MAPRYREKGLQAPVSQQIRARARATSATSGEAFEKLPKNQAVSCGAALGTVIANKETSLGVPHAVEPRAIRRRLSTALRRKDCKNLILATQHAVLIGRPLNRMLTIHFDAAGIVHPVNAIGKLLKLMGDWLRCYNTQITAVWVRESGLEKGEHVHILLSVPPNKIEAFNRRQRSWFKRLGASWRKGVYLSRPIGPHLRTAFNDLSADLYQQELSGALSYLLKGADDEAQKAEGLRRCEPGGEVSGKRCGTTENIGKTARDRFNRLK